MKIDEQITDMSFGQIIPNVGESFMIADHDIVYMRIVPYEYNDKRRSIIHVVDLVDGICGLLDSNEIVKFHIIKTKVVLDK